MRFTRAELQVLLAAANHFLPNCSGCPKLETDLTAAGAKLAGMLNAGTSSHIRREDDREG